MKKIIHSLLFISILLFTFTSLAWDFNADIRKKQEAKDAKRWSLSQWLEQKSKVKLMDSWLSYNKPSPYEFFFSIDTSTVEASLDTGTAKTSDNFRNYRGAFGAMVTVVGLYGEYEFSDEELEQWKTLLLIRLLGSSDQATNLTLHYGLMNQSFNNSTLVSSDQTQFQVAGARLNFYLIGALAITGSYEQYFEGKSHNSQVEQEGHRFEYGAFIEYGALRLYGSLYTENIEWLPSAGAQKTKRTRKGLLFGTRLYF